MADAAQRSRSATLAAPQPVPSADALVTDPIGDDDLLDELSNSVLDLIKEKRYIEALAVCDRLRTEYPHTIDWLDRSAMVLEARGDLTPAVAFYRRALAFTEQPDHLDYFDDEGREYFRQKIVQLEARIPAAD